MTIQNIDSLPFIGIGWGFPPTFNKAKKTVEMTSGTLDIKQSLEILLSTKIGERIMNPKFGCNLFSLTFENFDLSAQKFLENLIQTAVYYYETRIKIENILFEVDHYEGKVLINIDYIVKTTNSRSNIVYPFYLTEGTNIF